MACIYILFSKSTQKFYTGSSRENDASKRLGNHNKGRVKSTKYGRPWILVKNEKFDNYTKARKKELFLKTGAGRDLINKELGHFKNSG